MDNVRQKGLPASIIIERQPLCRESWWLGKDREAFYAAWRVRVPKMALTRATTNLTRSTLSDE